MNGSRPAVILPLQHTSFIGRETETAEILALLDDPACRLLTLTGPGGCGKTRLAVEAARKTSFGDGICFVPLQPLQSPQQVTGAIINALHLRPDERTGQKQALLAYLQNKHLLLVLDNFEHVLDAADLVADVLDSAPHVKLLVTSRERLSLQVEQVWPVGGLEVPELSAGMPDTHSAVQLFVERARRVQPHFSLDSQQDAVIRICQQVDGLPLALELAASWTRVLACEVIATEIQRNIDILTTSERDLPERHRSIRAVFDHSWHLLDEPERAVFRRLAVFRGGFTAESARDISGASLHDLSALIDKSLLRMSDDGRYDLHELVRQYAEGQLEAASEVEATLDKHCETFLSFMQHHEADLKGLWQVEALDAIEVDFENVRAAWQRAVESRHHGLVNAAVESLFLFTVLRSRVQDHNLLFGPALTAFPPGDHAASTWGRILARSYRFFTTNYHQPQPDAVAISETALEIARSNHDRYEMAVCLYLLGKLTAPDDEAQALVFLEESLEHFEAVGEHFYRAYLLQDIFQCRNWIGQLEAAIAALKASLELCRTYNLQSPVARVLNMVGIDEAFRNGNYREGERYIREAVNLCRAMNSRGETARYLRWLATIVFVQGQIEEARMLAEECRAIAYDLHDFEYLSVSSAMLAMVHVMQGDYQRGEELGRESFVDAATPPVLFWTHWSLACAGCGLDEITLAGDHLRLALEQIENIVTQTGFKLLCAPVAAILYARQHRPEKAVELLALAYTHPKSPTGWLDQWPLLNDLHDQVKAQLREAAYASAWEKGMALDLNRVTQELLREFTAPGDDPVAMANESLPEPLTPRELEILRLLAEGLTNAQIAERLFVTIGTVKWHLNRVFQKLDVEHRQQAIVRARELRLIKP